MKILQISAENWVKLSIFSGTQYRIVQIMKSKNQTAFHAVMIQRRKQKSDNIYFRKHYGFKRDRAMRYMTQKPLQTNFTQEELLEGE